MRGSVYFRIALLLSILVLGVLAYYGLHRDIRDTANPCVVSPRGSSCVHYACNIASIIRSEPLSPLCRRVVAGRVVR